MDYMSHRETKGVPDFAYGLEILLIDHDTMSLMHTESVLQYYSFKVTATEQATVALSMLRERRDHYKLVLANTNMPDIDSLHFVHALLETEIPVILMSSKMNVDLARKALAAGACLFIEKPVSFEDLKNVWQHVYREINRRKETNSQNEYREAVSTVSTKGISGVHWSDTGHDLSGIDTQNTSSLTCKSGEVYVVDRNQELELRSYRIENLLTTGCQEQITDGITTEQIDSDGITKNIEETVNKHSTANSKDKRRAVWTPELHLRFVAAVSSLGDEKARPKEIHKLMNAKHLTMRQIASHLQKYKNQVNQINHADTSSPSTSNPSSFNNRNEFVAATQTSLLFQNRQGTSGFGVLWDKKNISSTTPNPFTRLSNSKASSINEDYRMQIVNTRDVSLSHYKDHHSSDFYSRTHEKFQTLSTIPEKRCFPYKSDMNEIVKKKPRGLEESHLKVTGNLPSMNYMTPQVASPIRSENEFKPNEISASNQDECCAPALVDPFKFGNKDHFSTSVEEETKVQKNSPSMNCMTPKVVPPIMTANTLQPDETAALSEDQYFSPTLIDFFDFENIDQLSTEVEGKTEELELPQMNLPSPTCLTPEVHSPHIPVNAVQFPNELDAMIRGHTTTITVLKNSNNQHQFSTEVAGTKELLEHAQLNVPSLNTMTPKTDCDYTSDTTFQIPNEPLHSNQEQYHTPGLISPFSSQSRNNFSSEVAGLTEHDLLVQEIASGYNAKKLENFSAEINNELDTFAGEIPPETSSNEHQSLSEYADLLKMLEEDQHEYNSFGTAPKAGHVDSYCEELQKTLLEGVTHEE